MYSVNYFSNAEDGKHIYKHKEYFFFRSNANRRIEYIKKYHKPLKGVHDPFGDLRPYVGLTESATLGNIWRAIWQIKELYEYC